MGGATTNVPSLNLSPISSMKIGQMLRSPRYSTKKDYEVKYGIAARKKRIERMGHDESDIDTNKTNRLS